MSTPVTQPSGRPIMNLDESGDSRGQSVLAGSVGGGGPSEHLAPAWAMVAAYRAEVGYAVPAVARTPRGPLPGSSAPTCPCRDSARPALCIAGQRGGRTQVGDHRRPVPSASAQRNAPARAPSTMVLDARRARWRMVICRTLPIAVPPIACVQLPEFQCVGLAFAPAPVCRSSSASAAGQSGSVPPSGSSHCRVPIPDPWRREPCPGVMSPHPLRGVGSNDGTSGAGGGGASVGRANTPIPHRTRAPGHTARVPAYGRCRHHGRSTSPVSATFSTPPSGSEAREGTNRRREGSVMVDACCLRGHADVIPVSDDVHRLHGRPVHAGDVGGWGCQ